METPEQIETMDLEEIRSIATANSARIAELGEWPEHKAVNAVESVAGRIPLKGQENAQGLDAGLAAALDLIPRDKQKLIAALHGNYTPETVAQVVKEAKTMEPDSETAFWLAASAVCNMTTSRGKNLHEGNVNEEDFREQLKTLQDYLADKKTIKEVAKKDYAKMCSSFETATYGVPFGTSDGCIQGAYVAGYPYGGMYAGDERRFYIGTYFPSLGLEDFEWSKEIDEKDPKRRPKSGPVHGSKQFVKCASEEEFKRALEVVKKHHPTQESVNKD